MQILSKSLMKSLLFLILIGMLIASIKIANVCFVSALPSHQYLFAAPSHTSLTNSTANTRLNVNVSTFSADNIELQYPADWRVLHLTNDTISFVYPFAVSSLTVSIKALPKNITTLNQYTAFQIGKLKDTLNDSFQLVGVPFKIIKSTSATIANGNPAHELVYTYAGGPDLSNFKDKEIWMVKDGKVYDIKYESFPSHYEHFLPVVDSMINSFRVTNP